MTFLSPNTSERIVSRNISGRVTVAVASVEIAYNNPQIVISFPEPKKRHLKICQQHTSATFNFYVGSRYDLQYLFISSSIKAREFTIFTGRLRSASERLSSPSLNVRAFMGRLNILSCKGRKLHGFSVRGDTDDWMNPIIIHVLRNPLIQVYVKYVPDTKSDEKM